MESLEVLLIFLGRIVLNLLDRKNARLLRVIGITNTFRVRDAAHSSLVCGFDLLPVFRPEVALRIGILDRGEL